MRSPLAMLLSLPVRFYRRVISPLKPPTCRFHPTCSSYALEALRAHGAFKGSWLTLRRLCRCHPFCEAGYDPVPDRSGRTTAERANQAEQIEPTRLTSPETDQAPRP